MALKTRLYFLFAGVAVVVGITLACLLYAEFQINRSLGVAQKAYSIVNVVSQLNRLATEISFESIPRLQRVWAKKLISLERAVRTYQGNDAVIARMGREMAQLDHVFKVLVATFDTPALPDATGLNFEPARMHRIQRLTEMLQSISGLADRIAEESHARVRLVQKKRDLLLSGTLIFWSVFILVWGAALRRGIAAPLAGFMDSISIVGKGDLSHRIKVTQKNDEINTLMVSFNAMLDRLAHLTVSRKKVLDAAEQERLRIGWDLHDGACQVLAGICMKLEAASPNGLDKADIPPILSQIARTQAEIGQISKDLHPTMLEEFGIIMTLEWLCDKYGNGVEIIFQPHVDEEDIPGNLHNAIFRVTQEALGNIHSHSGADTAYVQINKGDGTIDLCIEDDGQGFDTAGKYSGTGLINMYERTAAEQGDLTVNSSPGQGCSIIASFPEFPSYPVQDPGGAHLGG